MYKTFILPLKSAFALSAFFILTACGGFTIDLDSLLQNNDSLSQNSECFTNPFLTECDDQPNISTIRSSVINDCANNPDTADTQLCAAADAATSDNENGATGAGGDNTPKDIGTKPEFAKNGFTKTDKEKSENTGLEIVDLCSDPANAGNEQCSPAVIDCINNPFSGSCQGDNLLGNFVRDGVTVSKTVVLQDKRAEDCRTGRIDRALCQNLSVQKQRCTGAAFSDAICSAVTHSVCKADAFDPLCGEKEDVLGVYFSERSNVCFDQPNNPHCTGRNGHVAVVCSEYPFDRLCTGNADYDDARANACEANPSVSSECPTAPVPEVADVCLDNPFGPTCADSDYNNARKDLAKTCAIQAVTGLVTSACDTIIEQALPCFIDPFDTVCDSNPAVRSYIAELRSSRVTLCKNSGGLFDHLIAPLCTGAPVAKSVCRIDPFNDVCIGDNDYDADRESICRTGSNEPYCLDIIIGVCDVDPLDSFCGRLYWVEGRYRNVRETICRADPDNSRCGVVIGNICHNDPFDSLCDSDYFDSRVSRCRDGSANVWQCDNIIRGVCRDDPFDSLCGNGYTDARLSACRDGSASSGQCGDIIAGVCRNNPFDSLCGSGYNNARLSACRDGSASSGQCGDIIAGVCRNNPFDSLCGSGYNNARETTCYSNPSSRKCSDTVVRVCNDDPFNSLCRNVQSYINERKTICRANSNNWRCGSLIRSVCRNNPFDRMCNSFYDHPRETACRNGSASRWQCRTTVAGVCRNNPFDSLCGSGYTQTRRALCTDNPFAPRCAGEGYNDLRVSFCEGKVGTHRSCPAPTPQVTAKVWADSFDTPLAHGVTADDTESKFLIGKATDLDTGGVDALSTNPNYFGNLNLADATFNGTALGGDVADGMAFFAAGYANNGRLYSYAGILEGTNLGAPLADTAGTAKWIGSFKKEGSYPTDFVLNISFGTGAGAGEIEALVQNYGYSSYQHDFHVKGEFDDAGVITGAVHRGNFKTNDTDNRGTVVSSTGKLTGLIGEEGAVGAFLLGNTFGGFVARPSSTAELRTLAQTCTDDPFNKGCTIGYESQRDARLDHCIIGGNANDASCDSAKGLHPCINNPFKSNCSAYLSQHYEQARVNRVAFCRMAENAENDLCTSWNTLNHVCTNHPFARLCRGDNSYRSIRRDACTDNPFAPRCAGNVYNDLRVSFCAANAGNRACPRPDTTPNRVTTADWLASFDEDLPVRRRRPLNGRIGFPYTGENHFVKASETGLDLTNYIRATHKVITFANVTFDGKAVGGDAADGFALSFNSYAQHAGILADTDLGAPLTQRQGSASWNARMVVLANKSEAVVGDFILHINFGAGGQAGTITGQAIAKSYGVRALNGPDYRYRLDGEFDDSGVITGTSQFGNFKNRDTETPKYGQISGTLTGLIGEEGAIGAFISNRGGYTGYAGGFIATPSLQNYVSSADLDDYYHLTWPTDPLYRNETSSFLAVSATGEMNTGTLLTRDGSTPTVETLTLANATYQGRALGGDATDGIAFFKGWKGPTDTTRSTKIHYRVYSGIFDDINLGAPVTETSGKAYWKGQFKSVHFDRVVSKDFTLEVSFSNRVRTAGRVDALVHDTGSKHFKVSASFNHRGVIDGRVIFGDYENNNRSAPHTSYRYADLVGLIGQEGVVAMFKRSPPPPSSSGRSPSLDFAGGFVAVPNLPPVVDTTPNRVTTADWVASFQATPLNAPISYGGQFLQGNETKLNPGALFPNADGIRSKTFANTGYGHVTFNTDAVGGYSYFQGYTGRSSTTHYYAGILSNTDLGAPLTQTSGSLYWKGSASYHHRRPGSGTGADRSMILKISFGNGGQGNAGTVNSTINADSFESRFDLEGVFNHQGVISGTATLIHNETATFGSLWAASNRYAGTQISGVLSGLIGQEGAVGAFYSKRKASDTGKGIFGGGFIAAPSFVDVTPPASTSDRVTTADSLASFRTSLVATPSYRNKNYFLKATQTGLNTGEYTNLGSSPIVYSLTLAEVTRNGQTSDGVAFFKGGVEVSNTREIELGGYAYAGILSDTDLGAPLTSSSGTASWKGRLVAEFNNKNTIEFIRRNITLEVSFDNAGSGNAGKITSIINATADTEFEIDGVFNSQGVMSGAVSTIHTLPFPDGSLSDNRYINRGLLTGLIGQEGAVGAFVSPPHIRSGFVGGFVAAPDFVYVRPPDTTPNLVTRADWLEASFETAPALIADANTNHFVQLPDEFPGAAIGFRANIFAYRSNFWNKTIYYMTFDDDVQTGIWNTPFALAFAHASRGDIDDESNAYFYAGILLKDRDLGAPLTETSGTATWSGRFEAVLSGSGSALLDFNRDFTLNITFSTAGGDISTAVSGGTEDYLELDGTFNDRGVISGTANHVYYENGRIGEVTGDIVNSGPVTGLIGQEGAIGVFVSNRQTGPSAGSGFAGGFVARPPSQ